MPNFSTIASPLTDLGKKYWPNNIKGWQDHHDKVFQTLKSWFQFSFILYLPVFQNGIPYIVRLDASNTGLGAVFSKSSKAKASFLLLTQVENS